MFRFFTVILSVIIMSLTIIPCSDDLHFSDSGLLNSSIEHDHSTSDQHDNCSPFCVCNCCKTNTVYSIKNHQLSEIKDFNVLVKSYPFLEEQLYKNTVLDIWQPPKLS